MSDSLDMVDPHERFHKSSEKKQGDERDPVQTDRDRLLYSNAFRRLAGVTQVTSPIEGDIVHNRLTHTLKVAQISRRLSEQLIRDSDNGRNAELKDCGGIEPEASEASAFAHDLGHPPFGHIGEQQLNRCLKGDVQEGYEGNAQSLRIVSKLSVRVSNEDGLNLTRRTLDGLMKYPWLYRKDKKKWGAYTEEKEIFEWVREGKSDDTRSLEAEVMDWADDITYAVHDVDDFYRAGMIPLRELANTSSDESQIFLDSVKQRWQDKFPERYAKWDYYEQAYKDVMQYLPLRRYSGGRKEQARVRAQCSHLITRFLSSLSLEHDQKHMLIIPEESKYEVEILKDLIWHYVIRSSSLKTQQKGNKLVIKTLFNIFRGDKNCELVPPWIAAEIDYDCSKKRRAADIVSSLTDNQALRLYQRLTGYHPGSIRDWG